MKKLNFGCGKKNIPFYDNVDEKDFDFNVFPYPIADDTYEDILVDNVLEHLDYPDRVLKELRRISKNNAIIRIRVPHHNSSGAYNSLQHKHYFNENAFKEFTYYNKGFAIKRLAVVYTTLGRYIPFANFVSKYINHIKGSIICEMVVRKNEGVDKRKILNNCVEPELGLHIFKCAFKDRQKTL